MIRQSSPYLPATGYFYAHFALRQSCAGSWCDTRNPLHLAVLASELPVHGDDDARIDAVALDSSHRPVIIEFKRAVSGTAICQGLYYLDWLTHRRECLAEPVVECVGPRAARRIDWSVPRVLCIAEVISEREEAVARQIGRQVERIAVRRLNGGLVLLRRHRRPSPA